MTNIIRRIRNTISKEVNKETTIRDTDIISIEIFPTDEIVFYIYEVEIPIVVNISSNEVFLDCRTTDNKLSSEMLNELSTICRMLEKNLPTLKEIFN